LYRLTSHGTGLALAEIHNSGDQDSRRNITSVTSTLTTLCANNINAKVEALLHMFWVANHVHVEDAILVEAVNDGFGWNTDGGNKELGTAVDDDINKLVKLALCVVVAVKAIYVSIVIMMKLPRHL
jgi:hypothetical protein